MKRKLVAACLAVLLGSLSTAQGQVATLGHAANESHLAPASCQSCGGAGLWGGYGSHVHGSHGFGGPLDPGHCDDGSGCHSGLGYAGGFGGCHSCGVGGYAGRGIHPVAPCACGGSLVADLALGVQHVVGRALNCVAGTVKTVGCHATGSVIALQHAAHTVLCSSCGTSCGGTCGGCDHSEPNCGCETGGMVHHGMITESPVYGPTSYGPASYGPASTVAPAFESPAAPSGHDLQSPPQPMNGNPFQDDPVSAPNAQSRRMTQPVPMGFRLYQARKPQLRTAAGNVRSARPVSHSKQPGMASSSVVRAGGVAARQAGAGGGVQRASLEVPTPALRPTDDSVLPAPPLPAIEAEADSKSPVSRYRYGRVPQLRR